MRNSRRKSLFFLLILIVTWGAPVYGQGPNDELFEANLQWPLYAVNWLSVYESFPEMTMSPVRVGIWDVKYLVDGEDVDFTTSMSGFAPTLREDPGPAPGVGRPTGVAGVIGAVFDNNWMMAGMNPWARIYSASDQDQYDDIPDLDDWSSDIDWFRNQGCRIISDGSWTIDDPSQPWQTDGVLAKIKSLYESNILYVAPPRVHDSGECLPKTDWHLTVRGADDHFNLLPIDPSCTGEYDLVAPGGEVTSLKSAPPGTTDFQVYSDNAMAAGHVAGAASLLLSLRPDLTVNDLMELLIRTGEDFGVPNWGDGYLNVGGAVEKIRYPSQLDHHTRNGGWSHQTVEDLSVVFYGLGSDLHDGPYFVKRTEVRNAVSFGKTYEDVPWAWCNGPGTIGWSIRNPNYTEPWAGIVPGTLTRTGCTVRTFVYELFSIENGSLGFFPCAPENVRFSLSVVGIEDTPASWVEILGPNGGGAYRTGDEIQISWRLGDNNPPATGTNLYLVTEDRHGGSDITFIAGARSVDELGFGSFTWTVPSGPPHVENRCLIRAMVDGVQDYSNSYFSVEYDHKVLPPEPIPVTEGMQVGEITLTTRLQAASPNPFSPRTELRFELSEPGRTALEIFDVRGRLVRRLVENEWLQPGGHSRVWDGREVSGQSAAPGIYFAKMRSRQYTRSIRLVKLN